MNQNKLCLGTVQFGLNYGINNSSGRPSKPQLFTIIDEAIKQGITIFDTAAAYGTAEELLGEYGIGELGVRVISKLKPNVIHEHNFEPEFVLEEQVRESLARLGIQKLDGYLLHSPQDYYNKRIINGLRLCKEKGLIRHFGVSIYEMEHALDIVRDGVVDYVQIPYNVFDQRADQTIFFETAKKNKITVFARSVLLQGLIMMPEERIPVQLDMAKKYLRKFDSIIIKYGFTRLQAAFLFAYTHPGIDYLVIGIDNLQQLKSYIELANSRFNFLDCRRELAKSFFDVEKEMISPNLWNDKKV